MTTRFRALFVVVVVLCVRLPGHPVAAVARGPSQEAARRDFLTDVALIIAAGGAESDGATGVSVRNDVTAVADILRQRRLTEVVVLDTGHATGAGIERQIELLAGAKSKAPRALVYVSGPLAIRDGQLVLLLSGLRADARRDIEYTPSDGALETQRATETLEVNALVARLAAAGFKDLILILDGSTRTNGSVTDKEGSRAAVEAWVSVDLSPARNAVVIVAWPPARPRETKEALLHSPFSRALLDTWTDPAVAGKDGWTWLPRILVAVQSANDPQANPPQVQVFAKMTDAAAALWLDVPAVHAVPKGTPETKPSAPATQPTPQEQENRP